MFYNVRFKQGNRGKFRTWDDKVVDATDNLDKFIGKPVRAVMTYLQEVGAQWAVSAEYIPDKHQQH